MSKTKINHQSFITRFRKFTGYNFFKHLFSLEVTNLQDLSLEELAISFQKITKKSISKESVNKKFNKEGVVFLEEIVRRLLKNIINDSKKNISILNFSRTLIKDATSFNLPNCMKHKYKGSGGSGSGATIKIQFEYDILNGDIIDLSLNPFIKTDAQNSKETIEKINNNDLIIRDLGYISVDFLQGVQDKDAYFLNRLMPNVKVYYKDKNEKERSLKFKTLRRWMEIKKINTIEKEVYITDKRFKVRLIINLLPNEITAKRRAEKKKNAIKKGTKESIEAIERSCFNLFITNTKQEEISTQQVFDIYKLRWQIEILFKSFKQEIKIDQTKRTMKVERFECILWVKIITIIISFKTFNIINNYVWKKRKTLISIIKCISYFANYHQDTVELIFKNKIENYISGITTIIDRIKRETKKNFKTIKEILISL